MANPHPDSEEALENAAVDLFKALDWETINAQYEVLGLVVQKSRKKLWQQGF